jgi:hypothetical protein
MKNKESKPRSTKNELKTWMEAIMGSSKINQETIIHKGQFLHRQNASCNKCHSLYYVATILIIAFLIMNDCHENPFTHFKRQLLLSNFSFARM